MGARVLPHASLRGIGSRTLFRGGPRCRTMESNRRILTVLVVSSLVGALLFVAGFVTRPYLVPPPQQTNNTTIYHNTTIYQNGTFALGPSNVTDRRTVLRFDFPTPCASYLESRHTGVPNS